MAICLLLLTNLGGQNCTSFVEAGGCAGASKLQFHHRSPPHVWPTYRDGDGPRMCASHAAKRTRPLKTKGPARLRDRLKGSGLFVRQSASSDFLCVNSIAKRIDTASRPSTSIPTCSNSDTLPLNGASGGDGISESSHKL